MFILINIVAAFFIYLFLNGDKKQTKIYLLERMCVSEWSTAQQWPPVNSSTGCQLIVDGGANAERAHAFVRLDRVV